MEKAAIEHLRRVVIDNRGTDLFQVIALGHQVFRIGDRNAVDVIHNHHVLGAQVQIGFRHVTP